MVALTSVVPTCETRMSQCRHRISPVTVIMDHTFVLQQKGQLATCFRPVDSVRHQVFTPHHRQLYLCCVTSTQSLHRSHTMPCLCATFTAQTPDSTVMNGSTGLHHVSTMLRTEQTTNDAIKECHNSWQLTEPSYNLAAVAQQGCCRLLSCTHDGTVDVGGQVPWIQHLGTPGSLNTPCEHGKAWGAASCT